MIFFRPTKDSENPSVVHFEAIENEEVCATCQLEISGSRADVSAISCHKEKLYMIDGLIKSAFNYACSKNCYMGYCASDDFSHILDKMNFEKNNGVYFNDIPTILMGNCCKKQ